MEATYALMSVICTPYILSATEIDILTNQEEGKVFTGSIILTHGGRGQSDWALETSGTQ